MISSFNTKKMISYASLCFLLAFSFFPVLSLAEPSPGEVSDPGGTGITYECGNPDPAVGTAGNCDFNDMIAASKKFIDWGTTFALAFSVAVIAYAGFNYMISGDNPKKKTEANTMLLNALIGLAWILAAWLVVTLIANALLGSPVLSTVPPVGS